MYKILILLFLIPFTSGAFTVDSMMKISADEDYFLVTGNGKQDEYLYVTLSELVSGKNNAKKEIVYSAENTSAWPIVAEPAEIIISPGDQIKINITKNYSASGNDRIFGITFTPDILDQKNDKQYNIPFGYRSWLIVPGKEPLAGDMSARKGNRKGEYIISNQTNKVMDIKINYCGSEEDKCNSQLISRPYSDKTIMLGQTVSKVVIEFFSVVGDRSLPLKRIVI